MPIRASEVEGMCVVIRVSLGEGIGLRTVIVIRVPHQHLCSGDDTQQFDLFILSARAEIC